MIPDLDIAGEDSVGLRAATFPASASPAPAQEWRDADGSVFASCASVAGRHRVELPRLATFSFDARGGPVQAAPYPGVGAASVASAYRRSALPFVLHALGLEVLHASAVV